MEKVKGDQGNGTKEKGPQKGIKKEKETAKGD